jgi:hypothetical protein
MDTNQKSGIRPFASYQIRILGRLDDDWMEWLNGTQITIENDTSESPISCIDGIIADQAGLRGILTRLWDLNLTLVSLLRTDLEQTSSTIERPYPDSMAGSN